LEPTAQGGGACSDQGDAECSSAKGKAVLSAAAVRTGLQKAAKGSWTIKLVCSHSPHTKCGCPFALEIKHRGDSIVDVWQTEAHQFHDPNSHADLSQLRMSPEAEAYATWLLESGTSPVRVALLVNNRLVRDGIAAVGCLDDCSGASNSAEPGSSEGSSSSSTSSSTGMALFSNARLFITKEQVKALQKRIQREAGFGLTTDERAVAAQMAVLAQQGCLALYQPYKQGGKEGKDGQPLIIILQTRFQKRMLLAFGRRLVFLDATGGTNKYGYMLYAVVVSGAAGRGDRQALCMAGMRKAATQVGRQAGKRAAKSAGRRTRGRHTVSTCITYSYTCCTCLPAGGGRERSRRARGLHDLQCRPR
jgi:hypothetical protein